MTKITLGGVTAPFTIDIDAGQRIVSALTRGSVESKGLTEGVDVVAVIKAIEVLIGTRATTRRCAMSRGDRGPERRRTDSTGDRSTWRRTVLRPRSTVVTAGLEAPPFSARRRASLERA